MAERVSAVAGLPSSASGHSSLVLREIRPRSVVQLTAWPETLQAVRAVIAELLGVAAPRLGSAAGDPNVTIAAAAPGSYLIAAAAPDLASRLQSALAAEQGTVTDLSHARTLFRLEGREAAAFLQTVIAIDLEQSAFPPGRIAQTAVHHIGVLVHRHGPAAFDLWAPRSLAESLAEWLLDAGLEFGLVFRR